MARPEEVRKRDLREMGWKALVTELGVTNVTRFILELCDGEQDYTKLRGKMFAGARLDDLYAEMRSAGDPRANRR